MNTQDMVMRARLNRYRFESYLAESDGFEDSKEAYSERKSLIERNNKFRTWDTSEVHELASLVMANLDDCDVCIADVMNDIEFFITRSYEYEPMAA